MVNAVNIAQPFQEAADFFKAKVNMPTKAWSDLWQSQHSIGFMVAGAETDGILNDFRNAIQKAIDDGTTLDDFRKDFDKIVAAHGWSYNGKRGWRSRVVYETNLRTAHAAGRWEQIEKAKRLRPYLMYVSVRDDRTRPAHKSWHGLILPVDHPFWDSHYPPNGWGCRCTVISVSERDLKKNGWRVSEWMQLEADKQHRVKIGGEWQTVTAPAGIDPGFAYNPGRNRLTGITPPPSPLEPAPGRGAPAGDVMPKPRNFPASKQLPAAKSGQMSEEDYVRSFLKEFGGDIDKPVTFKDALGDMLPISDELFRNRADGSWKVLKADRESWLLMLAESIKDPDEIWLDWFRRDDGVWEMRKRYISRFNVTGDQKAALTIFQITKSGWAEITNFAPNATKNAASQDRYLNKQRQGLRVWQRK